jgi:hypothetical protein
MIAERVAHLRRFYEILARLEFGCGGVRVLQACSARSEWPQRGVYFFFENGEVRSASGSGNRVVRVGTHAVSAGSRTTLWNRLSQHRGAADLTGNHRGSVFRLLVESALSARDPSLTVSTWAKGQSAPRDTRLAEQVLEQAVSRYVGTMPCLWVLIGDAPSPQSRRAYIERASIALLSNARIDETEASDRPSSTWLGLWCPRSNVRSSGLWNQRHIRAAYDPAFLDELERYVG